MTNTNPQLLILIGPPGSGKGTQAQLIKERLKFDLILSSSGIIREKFKSDNPSDPIVIEAKQQYRSGQLVNPSIVGQWTIDKIQSIVDSLKIGVIMDGTTRTIIEAEMVVPVFVELFGKENIHAIYLNADTAITAKRNMARLICQTCQRPIRPSTAQIGDSCPFKDCKGAVGKRDIDSDEEVILKRMEVYKRDTAPVLDILRKQDLLLEVDGSAPIEDVYTQIENKLKSVSS